VTKEPGPVQESMDADIDPLARLIPLTEGSPDSPQDSRTLSFTVETSVPRRPIVSGMSEVWGTAVPVLLGGALTLAGVLLNSALQTSSEDRKWKRAVRTEWYAEFLAAVDAVFFAESIVQTIRMSRDARRRNDSTVPPPEFLAEHGFSEPGASELALDAKRRLARAGAMIQLVGAEDVSIARARLQDYANTFNINDSKIEGQDAAWNSYVATARKDLGFDAFDMHGEPAQ
jgi:hypothetical protein